MHLGHVLYFNLSDTADILQHSRLYIKQANDALIRFGFCSPHYNCMPLYGCALWSFNSCVLKQLDVSLNKCLFTFSLSLVTVMQMSSSCVRCVSICFQQFYKLFQSASTNSNVLERTVFRSASISCHNFIGYNIKYGKEVVCSSFLNVRELRDKSLFVWGVSVAELNC